MTGFDELIDRLTSRLRVDPELRMDVANELRTHLEDSEADFLAAGYSADDAAAAAVKALGDEADLTRQLWHANRGRIRLRSVCKWAARVALVPGAIVVVLMVGWGASRYHAGTTVDPLGPLSPERLGSAAIEQMTPDQRLIVLGDPDAATYVQSQRAIADRWPNNPAYLANAVCAYVSAQDPYLPVCDSNEDTESRQWRVPPYNKLAPDGVDRDDPQEVLAGVLTELDRAAAADPDNALYPLMRSVVLIRASSEDLYYSVPYEQDRPTELPYVRIDDPAMFARGLEAMRLAADKPHCSTYQADLAIIRLNAIPMGSRLMDALAVPMSIDGEISGNWTSYRLAGRDWCQILLSYGLHLAVEGRGAEGLELNRTVQIMVAKQAAGSQMLLELLIATGSHARAMNNEVHIYEAMGQSEQAEQAKKRSERMHELHLSMLPTRYANKTEVARSMGYWHHLLPRPYADPRPMRRAEYAVAEQHALVGLLAAVLVVAIVAVLVTGISLLRPGADRPHLLFIGWNRIGRICLIAIVLPIGAYLAYTRLAPFSAQRYGLWYTLDRIVVEFAGAGIVILALLLGLTYRAVRQRAAEGGINVPDAIRLRHRKVFTIGTLAVALGLVGYIVAWELIGLGPRSTKRFDLGWRSDGFGWYITGTIGAFALLWALREAAAVIRLRGRLGVFRRTLIRSSIGVLAAAVIVIGLFCGLALRRAEATAVRHITGNAQVGLHNELELSSSRSLRDQMVLRHRRLMAEHADSD